MRKILVTAISGNVSNGILKILQDTGDEIYGCDINEYPVGMDKVKQYWKSDLAVSKEYIPNLMYKCKELGITHLIPVNEEEIKAVSTYAHMFRSAGIKVMVNHPSVLALFFDKYRTYEYLGSLEGISVPSTYQYDEFKEDGKKYIVKLRQSCGSKFLETVTKKAELEQFGIDLKECVVQEYIENGEEEYTVGVFSDGDSVAVIIFRRKLTHGYTSFVEMVQDEGIEREAGIIAKSLNLQGYINIQLRKRDGKNYIFEINPRISGTVVFRHQLGFSDVVWWLDMLDGTKMPAYKCKYKTAIGMRELHEKFVELRENRKERFP